MKFQHVVIKTMCELIVMIGLLSCLANAAETDLYEPDDDPINARAIGFMNNSQSHNFHHAEDVDWLKFYALSDELYTIKTSSVGSDCDIAICVYKESEFNSSLMCKNSYGKGIAETMFWRCTEKGVYYFKIWQVQEEGVDTQYHIEIDSNTAPLSGTINGNVKNCYGKPLEGALITLTGHHPEFCEADGFYSIDAPEGSWILTANIEGYIDASVSITIKSDETLTLPIVMITEDLCGAIPILQLFTGQMASLQKEHIDINSDGKIGLEEAIYILKQISNCNQTGRRKSK